MIGHSGDVAIVGGGVIGLAIAFELAERGVNVRVFDRDEPAHAASWAAAGMLAPYTERITNEALLQLCATSLDEYPRFLERVIAAGAVDPGLRLNGVFYAAFTDGGLESLQRHAHHLQSRGVECVVMDRHAARDEAPWCGPDVLGGVIVQGEGYVHNRRLGRALVSACEARGVRVERSAKIVVESDARRVLGLRTDFGFVGAEAVVNACGAWAAHLHGVPTDCIAPVQPVRGQMLALGMPIPFVHRATWVPGAYLVPRDDGRLLVGATVESAGFDLRVTPEGMHELLHAALAAAPMLGDLAMVETWSGLRPGTRDGLPILGTTPLAGYFLATGHYRNGILLTPVTARLVADAIEHGTRAALEPFSLARFGTEPVAAARSTTT
jgi:glycine oxidase